MENSIGLVESLRVTGPATPRPRAESYSPDFQVCLPYHGAFVWHVGHDDVVADANRVLFVAGGEEYRVSHPVQGGYAELIITVRPTLLTEMLGVPERQLAGHPLFRQRSRPAEMRLQRLGIECLHRCSHASWDHLAGENGQSTPVVVRGGGEAQPSPSGSSTRQEHPRTSRRWCGSPRGSNVGRRPASIHRVQPHRGRAAATPGVAALGVRSSGCPGPDGLASTWGLES
jgi:hypothetical protein